MENFKAFIDKKIDYLSKANNTFEYHMIDLPKSEMRWVEDACCDFLKEWYAKESFGDFVVSKLGITYIFKYNGRTFFIRFY